ncbi:MAG: hypothetical protein OXN17_18870 [Candidatus Poribacteria bacterium]|nr:hypothetical protein [Candidatus Poribacteria bacterium]MDE0503556.1 hypothetical protein [Candidatus Poribacteria bacterium]
MKPIIPTLAIALSLAACAAPKALDAPNIESQVVVTVYAGIVVVTAFVFALYMYYDPTRYWGFDVVNP